MVSVNTLRYDGLLNQDRRKIKIKDNHLHYVSVVKESHKTKILIMRTFHTFTSYFFPFSF